MHRACGPRVHTVPRAHLTLSHYYRKGLHRRFKSVIIDGFRSRLSLWVSDDMRSLQTVFKPSVMHAITYDY